MLHFMTNGIRPSCPTLLIDRGSRFTAAMMALPDADVSQWLTFTFPPDEHPLVSIKKSLDEAKLPAPAQTLICDMHGACASAETNVSERRARRILRWKDALHRTEGRPELFLQEELEGWEAQALLLDARRTFGSALGTDSGLAALLAALSMDALRDRSWREGVTVIWAGYSHIQAFMIYQEKLLGLYEQHSGISKDALLKDLEQLRLNWLPDEQVRAAGGHGCLCGDFPAEAEGFRPTWILGPRRSALEGCGRLISPCGDDKFDRCFGLLFGNTLRKTA